MIADTLNLKFTRWAAKNKIKGVGKCRRKRRRGRSVVLRLATLKKGTILVHYNFRA